jgi:hypothetical protein
MQIVINISKDDFEEICMQARMVEDTGSLFGRIRKAISHGTPLPKGHGRLIDADALEKEMTNGINAGNYEEGYETFAHVNNMDDCVECVKYADTIIEADEEMKSEV